MILCIETATEACSVAIGDKGKLVCEKTLPNGQRHSSQLSVIIDEVITEAGIKATDLVAICISDGPGSYTGLRVGASTAKGLCFGLDVPLIAISTLRALADPWLGKSHSVMPTIDARRMESYTTIISNTGETILHPGSTIWTKEVFQELQETYGSLIICGNGIEKASALLPSGSTICIKPSTCTASLLVSLAYEAYQQNNFSDVAYHSPFYYKAPNITKSKKMLR